MNWAGSPLKPENSRASEHVDSLEFLPCNLTQFYWIFGDSAQIVMAQIIETLPWLRNCSGNETIICFFLACHLEVHSVPGLWYSLSFYFSQLPVKTSCSLELKLQFDRTHLILRETAEGDWFPLTQRKYFLISTSSTLPPLTLPQPWQPPRRKITLFVMTQGAAERSTIPST